MKLYFIFVIILLNILKLKAIAKEKNEIIPDIDFRNFDVRERFYDCYNPGYDADLIVNLLIKLIKIA